MVRNDLKLRNESTQAAFVRKAYSTSNEKKESYDSKLRTNGETTKKNDIIEASILEDIKLHRYGSSELASSS